MPRKSGQPAGVDCPLFQRVLESKSEDGFPTLGAMEKALITRTLRESGWNRTIAAARLGIDRKTLYRKSHRLKIDVPLFEDEDGPPTTRSKVFNETQ